MATNEASVEAEIQAKNLNAPRLSPADIDDAIVTEYSMRASDALLGPIHDALKCLTICVLILRNGYTVVGKSACASPENYDAELGHKIAREDARRQIWALEGYALRNRLAEGV